MLSDEIKTGHIKHERNSAQSILVVGIVAILLLDLNVFASGEPASSANIANSQPSSFFIAEILARNSPKQLKVPAVEV